MRALLLALLLACAPEEPVDTGVAEVVVRSWFDGAPNAAGGRLVVQVEGPADEPVELPEPLVPALRFKEDGEARVEHLGDRVVTTRRWHFTGPEGSYEIPPLTATWTDAEGATHQASSSPLYADLGVAPPRPGELAEIIDPPRVWSIPWRPVLLGLSALGAVLGGLLALRRRAARRPPPPVAPEPPDVVALRAWDVARADPTLDDLARATAINRILRAYMEAALSFPAESWTTSEILAHLDHLEHLPPGNTPRARRLLRATDRVKYADEAARGDLFDDLDADLRAFVESTRPRTWEAP